MSKRFSSRFFVALLACVLIPNICLAASVFMTPASGGTSNGSKLRMKFKANTFGAMPGMQGQTVVVKTVEFNPTSQYNYYGSYYYSYSWSSVTVSDGVTYAYSQGVDVECPVSGTWVPYAYLSSTMTNVP